MMTMTEVSFEKRKEEHFHFIIGHCREQSTTHFLPDNQHFEMEFHNHRLNVLNNVKVHLQVVGCLPIHSDQLPIWWKYISANSIHIVCVFVLLTLYSLSSFWHFFYELKTFTDLPESVFWTSRSMVSLTIYSMLIWNRNDLNKLVDDFHGIINNRKCQ